MTFIDFSEEAQLPVNDSVERIYVILFINNICKVQGRCAEETHVYMVRV